jgi:ADP-ribosylglycohydrolase
MDFMSQERLLASEINQRREEGCDVSSIERRLVSILEDREDNWDKPLSSLWVDLERLTPEPDYKYHEPSDIESIWASRPEGKRKLSLSLSDGDYFDRVYGAWLGRCVGCVLGKPVEGWSRNRIEGYLRLSGSYPLDDYIPEVVPAPDGYVLHPSYPEAMRGGINGMPRDDDLDYTILGLHILEEYGFGFTASDVASEWLTHLPYNLVYTAERVAYKNIINGLKPTETATYRNPYREWIGAQIRADIFGYVSPGLPEAAAELAFRDASLSHVKNGIYGEMIVAAMISAAFVLDDVEEIIKMGLAEIPENSRLAESVRNLMTWSKKYPDWGSCWDRIMEDYGELSWVHTINNTLFILLGLLYGEGDLGKTVSISVMAGHDTDCTGASVGSIIGTMLGAKGLEAKWVDPLQDRVQSILAGFSESNISELARKTVILGETFRAMHS